MKQSLALVTGASRGIGKATAILLQSKGYNVVGLYKTNESAAKALVEHGIDMQRADVSHWRDVVRVLNYVIEKYERIDVLINNAGINLQRTIEQCSLREWQELIATDLTSVFLMSKFAIPYLAKSDEGCIINVSSRIGLNDYAEAEFVPYGAAKAAVNNFTVGLAQELKSMGIRVNAVIPAPTKTDLFDQVFTPEDEKALIARGKLGKPEDVAELVLATVQDKTMTGELVFDGRVLL